MSQTSTLTTTSRARIRAVGYPSDYDLHHSGPSVGNDAAAHEELPGPSNTDGDAPGWPANYRRIPPYRPVNRNLDQRERRVYTSVAERIFITIMFTGVSTNARANWLWRLTGQRFNDDMFKYTIGGEF